MTAEQTIEHFDNMGVLDRVLVSAAGRLILIEASASEGYAYRCMQDFQSTPGYYKGCTGIDGVTSDMVQVTMTFTPIR